MSDDYFKIVLVVVSLFCGYLSTSFYYDAKIADMEKANAEAVALAEKKNAEGLAKATNTINLAQAEYSDLRGELDRARARLRHALNSRGADNSADALRARVARLEDLVQRLADAGTECGRRYQRSAQQHDALAEAVK